MSEQLRSGQPRLPLTNIQNKAKNHIENTKLLKTVKPQNRSIEEELNNKKDYIIPDNIVSSDNSTNKLSEEEENIGNIHFTIQIQKALKEAIEQNDKYRQKINELLLQNEKLKKESDEKDEALLELAAQYEHCLKHHVNKEVNSELDNKDLNSC